MGVVYPRKTDFQSPSVDQFVNNYLQHYAKMTGVNDTVCWIVGWFDGYSNVIAYFFN